MEGRAAIDGRLRPYASAVAADDALHDRKADTGPLVLLGAVQPLKDAEELPDVPNVEAHAVVFDEVRGLPVGAARAHLDLRDVARAREFERVGKEIDPDLLEKRGIRLAAREAPDERVHAPSLHLRRQLLEARPHELGRTDRLALERLPAQAREAEEVVDEAAHLLRVLPDFREVTQALRGELRAHLLDDDPAETVDGPEGGPEVVGDGVRERLELVVGRLELGRAIVDPPLEVLVQAANLLFGSPAFRDVARGREDALHGARLAAVHRGVVEDVRRAAGGMTDGQRVVPDRLLGQHFPIPVASALGLGEVVREVAADEVPAVRSGARLRRGIDVGDLPVGADRHERIQAGLDEAPGVERPGAKLRLRPLSLRDVAERENRSDETSARDDRTRPVVDRKALPVRAPEDLVFDVKFRFRLSDVARRALRARVLGPVPAVVVDPLVHGLAEKLFRTAIPEKRKS